MKIIKLHHPTGHPYWQAGEYKVEMPDRKILDLNKHFLNGNHGGYEILERNGEIYFQQCGSSSGGGKRRMHSPIKIVSAKEFDAIEYVGKPLVISDQLKNDLLENEMPSF